MQTLTGKAVGLPSLTLKPRAKRNNSGSCPAGQGGVPRLQRTWTLRSGGASSTACAAFLPFMEISVSVLDTIDLVRSSLEEEVVFQATLQVPAHHALACRIEAYDSPFAQAPDLRSAPDPHHLSEEDRQFAACLASPAEVEEPHSFSVGRTEQNLLQRSAPPVRFASGVLSLSFSMKQRSSSVRDSDLPGEGDDDNITPVPTLEPHTTSSSQAGGNTAMQPPHGSSSLAHAGSSGSSSTHVLHQDSSSFSLKSGAPGKLGRSSLEGYRPSRLGTVYSTIPEDTDSSPADATTAAAAAAAATAKPAAASATAGSSGAPSSFSFSFAAAPSGKQSVQQQQQQAPQRPSGLLRVESITAKGSRVDEIPLTTQLANKGVATLLGVGYMMLQSLESRTDPATTLLEYQVKSFTARPPTSDNNTWHAVPARVRC